jgi:mannose-6-phosphate isomerase-like protein (cupin superfamily)
MIQEIKFNGTVLAIIIRAGFTGEGIHFFTPNSFSQQLGYMKREAGYEIAPHLHNEVTRNVSYTKEVLYIKSGKVRVDFYGNEKNYLESTLLDAGDVILLAFGGHGFKIIESAEIIEVKQGPYLGEEDKTRFDSIDERKILLKGVA